MKALKNAIETRGHFINDEVLKVDAFLNHQIDCSLVDEMGKVKSVKTKEQGLEIEIQAEKIIENLKIGDSIATNGVCLTVTGCNENSFKADAMYETINRSNLKNLKTGDNVNLEKSLTLSTPLGGHLVTGDVDCESKIISINQFFFVFFWNTIFLKLFFLFFPKLRKIQLLFLPQLLEEK